MAHGKWYPTQLMLPDDQVLNLGGLDEYGSMNLLAEVHDAETKKHSIVHDPEPTDSYCVGQGSNIPASGSPCYGSPNRGVANIDISYYPKVHLKNKGIPSIGRMVMIPGSNLLALIRRAYYFSCELTKLRLYGFRINPDIR